MLLNDEYFFLLDVSEKETKQDIYGFIGDIRTLHSNSRPFVQTIFDDVLYRLQGRFSTDDELRNMPNIRLYFTEVKVHYDDSK